MHAPHEAHARPHGRYSDDNWELHRKIGNSTSENLLKRSDRISVTLSLAADKLDRGQSGQGAPGIDGNTMRVGQ